MYTRCVNICIQCVPCVVSSISVNYIQQSRALYWHYHSIGDYMESIESVSIMLPPCGDAVLPGQLLWNSLTFSILKTSSFLIKHNRCAFFHTGAVRVIHLTGLQTSQGICNEMKAIYALKIHPVPTNPMYKIRCNYYHIKGFKFLNSCLLLKMHMFDKLFYIFKL